MLSDEETLRRIYKTNAQRAALDFLSESLENEEYQAPEPPTIEVDEESAMPVKLDNLFEFES